MEITRRRDPRIRPKADADQSSVVQIWSVIQLIIEIIIVNLKLFYYTLESIYRLIIPPEPKSVRGEIVLITGTGHGIGKQLALQYAALGATVVGWDISKETNERTVQEIAEKGYPKAYPFVCDVSDREAVLRTAKEVQKTVGDVTILINNAGIMPARILEDHTPEVIEKMFQINVLAHFWTLEAFLPAMKRDNHGHIVALSSCAGLFGCPNLVPYCGSKYAVRGIMDALSEELRIYNPNNRIKFTTIMPSITDTGLCKEPILRFPSLTKLVPPETAAEEIVFAQRTDALQATIPRSLLRTINQLNVLPPKCGVVLRDFCEVGVGPDF